MNKYSFDDIRKEGLLLYEFIRGSHAYGTNTKDSDEDHGGVYIEPINQILGLGLDFQDEIKDEKSDIVWYSLKKYMRLLVISNPSILESLFVDDQFVLYEHPVITEIKKHRSEFVTKACFNGFVCYAIDQIRKAKGYNKMCNWQEVKRRGPIEFCYTFYGDGSKNIDAWLSDRGLKQKYCGVSSVNNMPGCHCVYYDWMGHIDGEHVEFYTNENEQENLFRRSFAEYVFDGHEINRGMWDEYISTHSPLGFHGIVKEGGFTDSDDIRYTTIPKGEKMICFMTYNKDGFHSNCIAYKRWTDWNKNKNKNRFISNLGYNYDSKNVAHSFRLLAMGIEIAKTGAVLVNRKGIDADFILDVRNHKYDYDYLINLLEERKSELDEAIEKCTLPECVDVERVNNMLIDIRRNYQLDKM